MPPLVLKVPQASQAALLLQAPQASQAALVLKAALVLQAPQASQAAQFVLPPSNPSVHLHMLEVGKQAHKFLSKGESKGIHITTLSILTQYSRYFLQGKI